MICNPIIQAILLLGIIIAAIYCGKLLAVYKVKYPLEYSSLRKSVIGREQTINILLKILISQDTTNDNEILKYRLLVRLIIIISIILSLSLVVLCKVISG